MCIESKKAKTSDSGGKSTDRRFPVRPLDAVIIAAVILLSLAPLLLFSRGTKDTVVVSWHGNEIYRGKLSAPARITTPDGLNTIIVENGEVHMLEASCADRICVFSGKATPAHPIICLPNRVIITVIGSDEADSVSW